MTPETKRVYHAALANQVEAQSVDEATLRERIGRLAGVHALTVGWPQLHLEATAFEVKVLDAFDRPYARLTLEPAGEGQLRATCEDLEPAQNTCERLVWPTLYPEAWGSAAQHADALARTAAELEHQEKLDAEIAKELAWEEQERAFKPYWGPMLAVAAEVGSTPGSGPLLGGWARAGARRYHGSFWSSGYAVQVGWLSGLVHVSVPARMELDLFGSHRGILPKAAAYVFLAPVGVLATKDSTFGGGVRLGIGGQAIVTGYTTGPLFSELSFEDVLVGGRRLTGIRFSLGIAL